MIISFNGDEGSGKSTIAEKVAQELGYPRYYMGQIFRDMAKKRGLSLVEYLKLGETDPNVDKEVDDYLLQIARGSSDFVIESRTAWHLIPQSLKIYLKVKEEEGAKRIFKQLQEKNSRNEDKKIDSIESVLASNRTRKETDDLRYKKYYGIDIRNPKNYDFVLDTTNLSPEEVFQKTISFIKEHKS
ncbi:MAG TPA: cytidylate kinase family protein [Candidatus Bathyarchaeia archaeon]|nr:cytidylate kinase family protein [Candidatus Bathyarchaeia archaeon]